MIDSVSQSAGAGADLKKARRQKSATVLIDRLPPHEPAAEQGVIGCCLISPKDCIGECITKIKSAKEWFYDLRHQTIYEVLVELWNENPAAIDVVILQARLKNKQLLEQIGGIAYLAQLQDAVPSAANLSYYLDLVREKFLLRSMIRTFTDAVGKIYDFTGEVDELVDAVEQEVLALTHVDDGITQSLGKLMPKTLTDIEAVLQNPQHAISGLKTGFADLDHMTDGLQNGEMIVIAARPSMGKTALAINIGAHVACELHLPVGVFSLEMTAEALSKRMICCEARVNLRDIKDGFLGPNDIQKLSTAGAKLAAAPFYIDDTSGLSILQLRARARRMHQQFGIKLFVIDYLQLAHSTSRKAQENRQIEICDISGGIKALAKELGVPIIALSQLNRELEKDKNRKPRLSDLRESGAIEQDADVVGLLYRPSDDDEASSEAEAAEGFPVNLLIAKQRNGPTGDVQLTFLRNYTRFESAAKIADEDVPQHSYQSPMSDA